MLEHGITPNVKPKPLDAPEQVSLYLDAPTIALLDAATATMDRSRSYVVRLLIRQASGVKDEPPDPAAQGEPK